MNWPSQGPRGSQEQWLPGESQLLFLKCDQNFPGRGLWLRVFLDLHGDLLSGGHVLAEIHFAEISGPDSFSDDPELGPDGPRSTRRRPRHVSQNRKNFRNRNSPKFDFHFWIFAIFHFSISLSSSFFNNLLRID